MICYVILHYQAIDETKKCIKSIKRCNKDSMIIVVDNASPNNSGCKLKEEFDGDNNVRIILSKKNSGFAKGNNLGYNVAKKMNPDYIVVLNSDVEVLQDDFEELLDAAYSKYHFDILGPDIYSTRLNYHQNPQRERNFSIEELRKSERILCLKNKFHFLLKIKYLFGSCKKIEQIENANYKDIQIGKVLHGSFYVFSSKYIKKHDECFFSKTFMYYESYILHYLGMRENLMFLYYPKIKVNHHEDASTNATYDNQYKKSVFVNRCLLESCREFIKIMKDNSLRLG
ncbi:glycosyltransferase [Selenomonas ruminantium]|uniref:glycosyltransferase n=1 Tax=Selenomonas ruminantium TaxID=971 RepID=UPI00156929F3|nr:glycosyltransferase [Selenomonas ruminantium]